MREALSHAMEREAERLRGGQVVGVVVIHYRHSDRPARVKEAGALPMCGGERIGFRSVSDQWTGPIDARGHVVGVVHCGCRGGQDLRASEAVGSVQRERRIVGRNQWQISENSYSPKNRGKSHNAAHPLDLIGACGPWLRVIAEPLREPPERGQFHMRQGTAVGDL